ncbi:MAG: TolC family protein [Magnetococcales bacterium]|nr:TolC family protein [Magnetococcales bacterium]
MRPLSAPSCRFPPPRRVLPALAAAWLLAGCTIDMEPLTHFQLKDRVRSDLKLAFSDQEPLSGPLNLYEAMARALRHNMEHRIKRMEDAVAQGSLDVARLEMLPRLAASAGYTSRINDDASISRPVHGGPTTPEPYSSRENNWGTADISTVWNILDFGLSYYQAKQDADRSLIARERRRKSVQNIFQEVETAFLRAAVADQLLPVMDNLLHAAQSALERSGAMERQQLGSPMQALEYQQGLLETVQSLWRIRRDMELSKLDLANLLNLKPGEVYRIDISNHIQLPPPTLWPVEQLEETALYSRSELREADYQVRISALDAKKAVVRMLPGIDLSGGLRYDSTQYLYNQTWGEAGMRISFNLFNLLKGPMGMSLEQTRQELTEMRRLALSMAVITQVNLAYQRFLMAQQENNLAQQLVSIHQRKAQHLAAARQASALSELEEIRHRVTALQAVMQAGLASAELQNATTRVYHSLGMDPIPRMTEALDLLSLTNAIRMHHAATFPRMQQLLAGLVDRSAEEAAPVSDRLTGDVADFFDFPEFPRDSWVERMRKAWVR